MWPCQSFYRTHRKYKISLPDKGGSGLIQTASWRVNWGRNSFLGLSFLQTMPILYRSIVFKSCSSYGKMMKEIIKKTTVMVLYLITGAVCGLLLNLIILHSPLSEIFPAYTEKFSGKLFEVDIIPGIFLYCLASPVLEEILFRRVAYDLLYKKIGFAGAALISSLIFAVYHMNMIQGIYAFIMGIFICALYYRDHRIAVPIALHIGANLAVWLFGHLCV